MTVDIGSRYQRTYDITEVDGKTHLSRRRSLGLPSRSDDLEYTTQTGDTLWNVAGQGQIYNDPKFWWVIADYNNLYNIFQLQFNGFPPGLVLKIPKLDRVKAHLNAFGV